MKHYIKNGLILVPLFFSQKIFDPHLLFSAFLGILAFSAISSAVYILNDLKDIQKDRVHPTKKNRPLASGRISKKNALFVFIICLLLSFLILLYLNNPAAVFFLLLYFTLNICYSMNLKNKPIIDIAILASGFVIRIFFGGAITGIPISKWLYLVVTTGSLYMGLGKRRNELRLQTDSREVLKYYTSNFLDRNMYVFVALTNVFYALWTIDLADQRMIWTTPVIMITLMRYSLVTEGDSDGDPVEVILHDKPLLCLAILYALCVFALLYLL